MMLGGWLLVSLSMATVVGLAIWAVVTPADRRGDQRVYAPALRPQSGARQRPARHDDQLKHRKERGSFGSCPAQ